MSLQTGQFLSAALGHDRCAGEHRSHRNHAQEHPTNRQKAPAQDCCKGQAVLVRQMQEAQPKARENAGTVALPEMSGGAGGTSRSQHMKILYLHGWNSVVGCVKPTYLKSHGHELIEPALDHEDFQAALETAQAAFDQHQPDVVAGASRGGAVA